MDISYVIIPLIVVSISQALKLGTDKIRGNLDVKNFFTFYGGMPSSHAALSSSITTLVGLRTGFDSAIFGVAFVFTLLVLRDAIALRNILGQQSSLLNQYRTQLTPKQRASLPILRERMGHTTSEVFAGCALGVLLTTLLNIF